MHEVVITEHSAAIGSSRPESAACIFLGMSPRLFIGNIIRAVPRQDQGLA